MPIGTPFHKRTLPLCESLNYREWSGYYTVSAYETHHEHEYNAIRNAAALIDISPLLKSLAEDADIENLKYFRVTKGIVAGVPVEISRTGYTGDLGYEIWVEAEQALIVWDALVEAGRIFDLKPAGMLALDVARIEAGVLLIGHDFNSRQEAPIV